MCLLSLCLWVICATFKMLSRSGQGRAEQNLRNCIPLAISNYRLGTHSEMTLVPNGSVVADVQTTGVYVRRLKTFLRGTSYISGFFKAKSELWHKNIFIWSQLNNTIGGLMSMV